jgi:GMP synthase (glutamine-hydrolysing)
LGVRLINRSRIRYHVAENTNDMRLLILQSRFTSDPMLDHERGCFIAATGRHVEELHFRNVMGGVPAVEEVTAYNAVIIGGSGDFSVVERDQPFFEPMGGLLRSLIDVSFPTFGCCFGYQLLVDAMGGTVIRDPENAELGSFDVELTEDGAHDPLFGQLPQTFIAQMGHFDRAQELPDGVRNLAASERCGHQALRIPGAPIWATQFHPELDEQGNRVRCVAYIKEFGEIEGYQALPSPEAMKILPKFLELAIA